MRDNFGREIDYLRLSITDRCNLRCRYCMPQEPISIPHTEILRFEEITRLCQILAKLGVHTIKITGGEPLVRKDCAELIAMLKQIDGIEHITITTNGVLLAQQLDALVQAGISAINVSLDSLNREQYARITGFDRLEQVLDGIHAALQAGIPLKINCVPLAATGSEQLLHLAALAEQLPIDVRFIEMMPIGNGENFAAFPMAELETLLHSRWELTPCGKKRGFGPAHYFTSPQLKGSIGLIDAVSHSFCARCNRVRLTAEGYLKLCLSSDLGLDLRQMLRDGCDDAAILDAIQTAILCKPAQHHFEQPKAQSRAMWQIGG